MKPNKQMEKEAKKAYEVYFDSYVKGDITSIESMLDDDYNQIGSAESEVFFNKHDALKFLHETIDQVAGKTEIRNRTLKAEPLKEYVLVTDLFDIYVLIENEWSFYSKFRASTLMERIDGKWVFVHQHSSVPDLKAQEGENIAIEKISEENLELREAIKRRTIELEDKNQELAIEASLERVRARTMAMQKSDELADASHLLVQQVKSLGIDTWGCAFNIFDEGQKSSTEWFSNEEGSFQTYKTPREGIFLRYYEAGKAGNELHIEEFKGKACQDHYEYLCTIPVAGDNLIKLKEAGVPFPTFQIDHVAFFKYGYLLFITFEPVPEAYEIFKRFAKVFEQTYTRFLDLQKAEAQVREAQIEAALETVRSRSLAMHKPEELQEVVTVVVEKLMELGVVLDVNGVVLCTYFKDSKDVLHWISSPDLTLAGSYLLPYFDHPIFYDSWNYKESGVDYSSKSYSKEEKDSFFEFAFEKSDYKNFPEEFKQWVFQNDKHSLSFAWAKNSAILIPSHTGILPTEEDKEILIRVAKVFEQAYIRFLDLQIAEAQAREAQIEAALERVRARTMAMHKSEELAETATVLFQQLNDLGVKPERINIGIVKEDQRIIELWLTEQGGKQINQLFKGSIDEPTTLSKVFSAWKKGKKSLVLEQSGKELTKWLKYLTSELGLPFNQELKQDQRYQSTAFFTHGMILMTTPDPLSKETLSLLPRFAKVFEQTYTRFLDLQMAEAQARESQIEAALERVRARTMAMHKSEELAETAAVLFQQFDELGVRPERINIGIVKEKERIIEWWSTEQGGKQINQLFKGSIDEPTTLSKVYSAWKRGEESMVLEQSGKKLKDWLQYMTEELGLPFKQELKQDRRYQSTAFFTHGTILMTTPDPLSKETLRLLPRFAKVFEQTYTRFLDLQKAEAQAREAEIEAALERVRARSMGMHKSEELNGLIGTVFTELTKLDLILTRSILMMIEPETRATRWWMANSESPSNPMNFLIQNHDHPAYLSSLDAWKKKTEKYTYILDGKNKIDWDNFLFAETELSKLPEFVIEGMKEPECVYISASYHKFGCLSVASLDSLSIEHFEILIRFTKVFEQTYTRFLDLQKAEAQVREAQIEAALERVRARSLAMHRSEELQDVVGEVYNQLIKLELKMDAVQIEEIKGDPVAMHVWVANDQLPYGKRFRIMHLGFKLLKGYTQARDNGEREYYGTMSKTSKNNYYKKAFEKTELRNIPESRKQKMLAGDGIGIYANIKKHISLQLLNFDRSTYTPIERKVIQRFADVFEQTYTRFLDLRRAEAQAREAQIEASLERVRSRAMAMHSTKDISDATTIVFNELTRLGVDMVRCGIGILHDTSSPLEIWSTPMSPKDKKVKEVITGYVESNSHPMIQSIFEAWKNNESYFVYTLHASEVRDYYEKLGKLPGYQFPKIAKYPKRQMAHCFYFEHGNIFVYSEDDLSEDQKQLLHRFTKVFSLTYKRYLDLKNAESQAREAQIEVALERVRSKTMAMHNSNDVGATIVTLFDEVSKLGLDNDIRCGIGILKGTERMETWSATSFPDGEVDLKMGMLDMKIDPLLKRIKKAWESGETHFADQMTGKSVVRYYTALNNEPDYSFHINLDTLPKKEFHNSFSFSEGILFSFSPNPMSEEAAKVLHRFARVFGQTYRRYVDLLKAEAQAREAQIEAALERIRSKALAMQSSADLHGVSMVLREQMGYLGQQELESSLIHLYNNPKTLESWYTFRSTETNSTKDVTDVAIIPVDSCEYIRETLEKYHSKEMEYTIVSKGKKLVDWYKVMVKVAPDTIEYDTKGKMLVPDILYYHHSKFIGGALLMISNEKPSEEAKELQRRAAKVFNLAYQRFIDFQQAEERARESLRQASLDRVRGEIASMRSKEDLNRITPLLWKELTALGVPFIRCGVFIMNEQEKNIESHLSAPDGKSLGVLNLPYDANEVGNNAVKYWRKGDIYTDHWNKKQFIKFMHKMQKLGQMSNPDIYQGSASPPESLDLHFVPFKQGMLYVGNSLALNEDELQLVKSLADAFSIAYARYEDFTQLETAKNQMELTLNELKSTQSQLIQSEKMASLGELTAGIAHEIQNPLNFVNNFSEVSKELIEEMNEEMEIGNLEEVKEITGDIMQNLDKIHHHGQRASSIVKGMLEHSRTGDRKKELTDINVLADEYLRLAYHGLRAKDKTFNADFKTELDESLPEIQVISQDICRVLLNLINNAFYTVSKKSKEGIEGYTPTVTVRTKSNDKTIELSVQDNGNGIPKDALDKIFQPFFTTKPAGEGTGLGLSLSYDIITQGHDGHLEVETEEGVGTRFIIRLPIV